MANRLGLPTVEGVYIKSLTSKEGGAALAGLNKGDVIISVNQVPTRTVPELQEQVGRFRPNDEVTIKYIRKGKYKEATVTLKNRLLKRGPVDLELEEDILESIGLELRPLRDSEYNRLDVDHGVKVLSIYKDSRIEDTNMDIGFVILEVNDERVESVEDVVVILEDADGEVVLKGMYEDYSGEYIYTFDVGE
jgi:S1-C subfamily serine protease